MKNGIIYITLLLLGLTVFAEGNQDDNRNYNGYGMMGSGMMRQGMMGNNSYFPENGERMDLESVKAIVEDYLENETEYDLSIAEIMEFRLNFYIQVADNNSDFLLEELIVDPYSGAIYPEHGPNMMWNLSTSHMMMGGYSNRTLKKMTVSESEAIKYAADFLNSALPGTTPEEHADMFNGYYTIHVEKDHNIIGMLSVNGYSGQVWYHDWHGEFLGMEESH